VTSQLLVPFLAIKIRREEKRVIKRFNLYFAMSADSDASLDLEVTYPQYLQCERWKQQMSVVGRQRAPAARQPEAARAGGPSLIRLEVPVGSCGPAPGRVRLALNPIHRILQ
jgi:hypothetical protein